MPPAGVLLILAAAGLIYYGGKAVVVPAAHGVKKAAIVLSHPFHHPVKDLKAVKAAVVRPPRVN